MVATHLLITNLPRPRHPSRELGQALEADTLEPVKNSRPQQVTAVDLRFFFAGPTADGARFRWCTPRCRGRRRRRCPWRPGARIDPPGVHHGSPAKPGIRGHGTKVIQGLSQQDPGRQAQKLRLSVGVFMCLVYHLIVAGAMGRHVWARKP